MYVFLSVCVVSGRPRARYHPAAWAARRWACCDAERRSAPGCALAAVWPLPDSHFEIIEPKDIWSVIKDNRTVDNVTSEYCFVLILVTIKSIKSFQSRYTQYFIVTSQSQRVNVIDQVKVKIILLKPFY